MRLKAILLGATLAGVTLIALPNLVQAQEVCFRSEVVPPYPRHSMIVQRQNFCYPQTRSPQL
ncbi:MAG TPA: hypothetical protein V6C90_00240 [Coleofasciculaceae cyanobacterium]|jgi:hypothetical protein